MGILRRISNLPMVTVRREKIEFKVGDGISQQTPSSNNTRDSSTHGYHQMSIPKSD